MLEKVAGVGYRKFPNRKRVQVFPDLGYETRYTSSGKIVAARPAIWRPVRTFPACVTARLTLHHCPRLSIFALLPDCEFSVVHDRKSVPVCGTKRLPARKSRSVERQPAAQDRECLLPPKPCDSRWPMPIPSRRLPYRSQAELLTG